MHHVLCMLRMLLRSLLMLLLLLMMHASEHSLIVGLADGRLAGVVARPPTFRVLTDGCSSRVVAVPV